jgi:hypothetical protein
MKVSFQFTLDEYYDAVMLSLRRGPSAWGQRAAEGVGAALVAGLGGYFLFSDISSPLRYWLWAGSILLTVPIAGWLAAQSRRTRIYEHLERVAGGLGPFQCDVEITPEKVVTRQFGIETQRGWETIFGVAETNRGVEFDCGGQGVIVVRARAFEGQSSRQEFYALALRYHSARGTGAATPERS